MAGEALKKETDLNSQTRLAKVTKKLQDKEKKMDSLSSAWESEKNKRGALSDAKERVEKARLDLERAMRKGDFGGAGELKHVKIPSLEAEVHRLSAQLEGEEEKDSIALSMMVPDSVTEDDIAVVVARSAPSSPPPLLFMPRSF